MNTIKSLFNEQAPYRKRYIGDTVWPIITTSQVREVLYADVAKGGRVRISYASWRYDIGRLKLR